MTNSILLTIYDDLEAMAVTYTDKSGANITANCLNLDEIPASVQSVHLPCRILLPIGQGQGGTPTAQVLFGAGIKATWNITDLFLLEVAARDAGLYIQAPVLMRYCVAYAEAIGRQFEFVHGWSTETNSLTASILPGMYEYPSGSGVWFYGVKCDLQIEEIF